MDNLEDLLDKALQGQFGSSNQSKETLVNFLLEQAFSSKKDKGTTEAFYLAARIVETAISERGNERLEAAYRRGFTDCERYYLELKAKYPTEVFVPGSVFIMFLRDGMPNRQKP